jgi:hypothetical protein
MSAPDTPTTIATARSAKRPVVNAYKRARCSWAPRGFRSSDSQPAPDNPAPSEVVGAGSPVGGSGRRVTSGVDRPLFLSPYHGIDTVDSSVIKVAVGADAGCRSPRPVARQARGRRHAAIGTARSIPLAIPVV